jgi:ligand-binding SRPBCC domain-containing protein
MPVIKIVTLINAPLQKCFDLSRSIDLHMHSMKHTKEVAIAGITSGLINLNETVTWKARHFGLIFTMTIKITAIQTADCFVDEQVKGPFKKLKHTHQFRLENKQTKMTDIFEFESPYGIIGKIVDRIFLETYMKRLLVRRNEVIKEEAEK